MHASPSSSLVFVGIDVVKDHLDVHLPPSGEAFSLARDADALEELVAQLVALAPELIVLEATGGSPPCSRSGSKTVLQAAYRPRPGYLGESAILH
jgi:hypothetical protein